MHLSWQPSGEPLSERTHYTRHPSHPPYSQSSHGCPGVQRGHIGHRSMKYGLNG